MGEHYTIDISNHDQLAQLAREDPQGFEQLRSKLVSALIDSEPERNQRRLRGLQFRVDCSRRLSRTPLAALLKIQSMMWDSFLQMDQELQKLARYAQDKAVSPIRMNGPSLNGSRPGIVIELQSYLANRNE